MLPACSALFVDDISFFGKFSVTSHDFALCAMSLRSHRNLFIMVQLAPPGEEEQQSRVEKRLEEEKKTKKVGREVAMAQGTMG